jgi:hypothetical protein
MSNVTIAIVLAIAVTIAVAVAVAIAVAVAVAVAIVVAVAVAVAVSGMSSHNRVETLTTSLLSALLPITIFVFVVLLVSCESHVAWGNSFYLSFLLSDKDNSSTLLSSLEDSFRLIVFP